MAAPIQKDQTWIDQVTMFLLIANTANASFYLSLQMLSISFAVLLILMLLKKGTHFQLNSYFWLFIITLVVLQIVQSLVYHAFPIKTFLGEYLRIIFAVLAIRILGDAFFERFVRFVYVFAVISLCFYIPCLLFKGLIPILTHLAEHFKTPSANPDEDFYNNAVSLIVFNLNQIDLHRNSGFYWEPGTHGGFLVMALFVNLFYRREIWKSRYNIVFFICILTTLSTTTYLALFFIILVYLRNFFFKRPALSAFILLAIVGLSLVLYNKLDFLNNKINKQIEYSNKGVPGESRFNSLLVDMKQMSEHPLIGTGRNKEMKFGKNFYNLKREAIHRNNGVGVLLSTYGIFFFILFFYLVWKTYYNLLQDKTNAWMAVLLLVIIGFSEDYFFKTFFIALALYCGITIIPLNKGRIGRSRKMKLGKNTLTYE
jgi:O-antigen ligase/polysaccharide polymerase Wzy-like membrane protein